MKLSNTKKQEDIIQDNTLPEQIEVVEEPQDDLSGLSLEEKIIYWKNKYKKIYKTVISGDTYIWRRLNRQEYSNISSKNISDNPKIDVYEKQYQYCLTAVLYPDNIQEVLDDVAGISVTLADEIIFKSGFGDMFPKTDEL